MYSVAFQYLAESTSIITMLILAVAVIGELKNIVKE